MERKRILIVYTGGTIGMRRTGRGYAPAPGFLEAQMSTMPELASELLPVYVLEEYEPLLDSANMTPADWRRIAGRIQANYEEFDGFVVLHGTDTMAYTASALPFMLHGLDKPVILTGSQIPLCEVRNDARENLITAMLIATEERLPEVCLYFNSRLLRGCRSTKVDADGFDAFASPNFPPLGRVGKGIEVRHDLVRGPETEPKRVEVRPFDEPMVAALRLFPGIGAEIMRNTLRAPLRGLVLEAFGVGNGPHRNLALMQVLREATDRGVVIVDCSQCLKGRVDLGDYATGAAMAAAGVVSGLDMTAEAALAKLFYLLSWSDDPEHIKREIGRNLKGELTVVAGC